MSPHMTINIFFDHIYDTCNLNCMTNLGLCQKVFVCQKKISSNKSQFLAVVEELPNKEYT